MRLRYLVLREEAREDEVRDAKEMVNQGPRVPGWPCKIDNNNEFEFLQGRLARK